MAENGSSSSRPETTRSAAAPADAPHRRVWNTEDLLGEDREVLIQHGDDLYRLRITRHGKLILYK